MKKKSAERHHGQRSDELRREYRFDYSKARPNRFASRARDGSVVVLLAPDVAKVFKDGHSVNQALRAILSAVPRKRSQPRAH